MDLARFAAGVLLLAHGLVHLLYLADAVPEFSLDRSWLVPDAARRPLALGLVATTIAAFAILALAVWGVPGLSARGQPSLSWHACSRWSCSSSSGTPGWCLAWGSISPFSRSQ